jgi:hypothetical protein
MKRLKTRSVCQCTSAKRVGCKVSAATAPATVTTLGWNTQAPGTSHGWSTQGSNVCYGHWPRPPPCCNTRLGIKLLFPELEHTSVVA